MTQRALLALESGTLFYGDGIGSSGITTGEVVFNTAMTGYQEILTDPSYSRQIVTLTYPHIGNTGINAVDMESVQPMAAGLVIRDCPPLASSWRCQQNLPAWLQANNLVAIADIDTRKLTRILRETGAQSGCVMVGEIDAEAAVKMARSFPGIKGMDLAREVCTRSSYEWTQGSWDLDNGQFAEPQAKWHIVAFDYGIKQNILRMLADRGCKVTVVPAQTTAAEVLALQPDGVFLSNGPGDPEPCDYAITAIAELLDAQVPVFGICLGLQLLALATGAKTVKMKFGHHGANHPVHDLDSGEVVISSQNHGFAVDEQSLPAHVRATHRSLFDGSLQGIELNNAPAFGFQGHPEASPGPHDLAFLFDRFIDLIKAASQTATATESLGVSSRA